MDLLVTAGLTGGFTDTLVIHDKSAAADPQLSGLTLGVTTSTGLTRHGRGKGSIAEETAAGQSVFVSPPPVGWVSGSAGSGAAGPGLGVRVVPVPAAYSSASVQMSVPAWLLSGPASSFPVYVDPAYSETPAWENYGEIQSAFPDAPELAGTYDGNVASGYDGGGIDRGEYVFGLPNAADASPVTIVSATMTATAVKTFTAASTAHTINAYYVSQYTSTSTWNNPPSVLAGPSAQAFTTTSTTPNQNVSWDVASWLQTAYTGNAFQMSIQLNNSDETDSVPLVEFGPNPTLSFTYTQPAPSVPVGTGPVSNATFLSFPVSDKVSLQVNVGSGNALVTTSDLTLPEAGGALTLGSDYNSLLVNSAVNTGADRNGWRQREGVDVRLYLGSDQTITLLGKDGTAGTFSAPAGSGHTYGSPAVFHATLTSAPTSSVCSGSAYQLSWHKSGEVMCFNANGLLTSQADRNGNTTAWSYNANGQETRVAYTPAGVSSPVETVTASYTGSYLTGLTESGGSTGTKTVTYGINGSGDLTSVQQPDGTTITLGYDGSHDLTSIQNGAGATTQLTYNSSAQVTSVTQPYGSSGATATTRLSYVSATETQVASPNTNQSQSVSSVPKTTYTINSQDLVTTAVDPATDTRSTGYTPFNDVQTATNGLSGGTTTNTYGSNLGESVTASQSPNFATTKLAYSTPASGANPEAAFEPSSSTDAQTNVTAYTYVGAGNLSQSSNTALAAAAKVSYNSTDGTPATSTDPDGGVTTYGYNSLRQLTTVTPPTNGSLKPITITYDGFGRVAAVTGGDGNTVTYTYDLADRITQEAYTGGPNTLTVTYAYDGAGNLHTQADASGTTTWTYDGRNQVLTKNAASGGGTLTYGYDADGNMTSSGDAGGTTTYTYNTRDLLFSLTDAAGKLWAFAYNAAGERTTTWFDTAPNEPTWAGKFITSYDPGGRISRIQDYRNSSTANVVSDVTYCYTKYVSGTTCPAPTVTTGTSLVQYSVNNQTSVVSVYTYDAGNRLSKVTNYGGATYPYTYDSDGNIKTGSPSGTVTYNTSNQITSTGHTYDGAGNISVNPNNGTQAYSDAGQLISASNATGGGGSGAESFTYAGASQDQVLSDGSATGITYGLASQYGQPWIQSYTPAGAAADYVIRDQQGDALGYLQGGASYAYATDNVGSVTAVINAAGTVQATYAYSPYGPLTAHTGSYTQNLIRYTGALTDTGTGTAGTTGYIHDGSRWYNPATDDFTTQDASSYLASPANGNRYAYAADNPINYTDPTGMCSPLFCEIGRILTNSAAIGGTTAFIGGSIACLVVGGPFDPPGCAAIGGATGLIAGAFGFVGGLGYSIAQAAGWRF